MLPWQPIFDGQVFLEKGKSLFKKKKNYFSITFMFLAHISVPLLAFITFCSILALS